MRRAIRLAITVDYKESAHVTIEDDGTSTEAVANWRVTMDDFNNKTQTKVHIADWPRPYRTGVELIAESFRRLGDVLRERRSSHGASDNHH